MKILILTPDIYLYNLIILTMLCMSSFVLPAQFFLKLPQNNKMNIMQMNVLLKTGIVIYGISLIPISWLVSNKILIDVVSLLIGLMLGIFILYIDQLISRKIYRKKANEQKRKSHHASKSLMMDDQECVMSLTSKGKNNHQPNVNKTKDFSDYSAIWNANIFTLVWIAFTEEVMFRGFLVIIALRYLSGIMQFMLLTLSVFIFGFSHQVMGNKQALLKGGHGFLLLLVTLLTHNIIAAVVAHIVLNIGVWHFNKKYHAELKLASV